MFPCSFFFHLAPSGVSSFFDASQNSCDTLYKVKELFDLNIASFFFLLSISVENCEKAVFSLIVQIEMEYDGSLCGKKKTMIIYSRATKRKCFGKNCSYKLLQHRFLTTDSA